MSSPAFTLQVSAGSDFRVLLSEVAGRYAELMGASTPEAEALARTLADKVESLAHGAHAQIEMACTSLPRGIDVTIRANGTTAVVHHPIAAGKS